MKKTKYLLLAGILTVIGLVGCGAGQGGDEGDLQRLAQIEIYASDGHLVNTILDEDILRQFNSLSYTDSEGDELASEAGNLTELYTIISYKTPVAVYNDGTLEKLMEW